MQIGKEILGIQDVLPGVPIMLKQVQVEGTFPGIYLYCIIRTVYLIIQKA